MSAPFSQLQALDALGQRAAMARVEPRGAAWQALVFCREGVHWCLPLNAVHEVLPARAWRTLPKAPKRYVGLLAVRGQLLPILDLAELASPARFFIGVGLPRCYVMLCVDDAYCISRDQAPEPARVDQPLACGQHRVGAHNCWLLDLAALRKKEEAYLGVD